MTDLLLLSGGLDSTAVSAWLRPSRCLFVDYGQLPSQGEQRAASAVARALELDLDCVKIDLTPVGSGIMQATGATLGLSPSVEWWPFRNQFLVTIAAAHALRIGLTKVLIGTVREDGFNFADGRAEFVQQLDRLLDLQEGGIQLDAPAISMTTVELLQTSNVPDSVLAWSQSCHLSSMACGGCPGCRRRSAALKEAQLLQVEI